MFAPVITMVLPERSTSGMVVLPNVWQERKVRTSANVGIVLRMEICRVLVQFNFEITPKFV